MKTRQLLKDPLLTSEAKDALQEAEEKMKPFQDAVSQARLDLIKCEQRNETEEIARRLTDRFWSRQEQIEASIGETGTFTAQCASDSMEARQAFFAMSQINPNERMSREQQDRWTDFKAGIDWLSRQLRTQKNKESLLA